MTNGPFSGTTLGELVRERGDELLGRHAGATRFPLLCKYLDATDRLSVQVHPNDERAHARAPGEPGKTEAWVILAAEPGSVVYAGLERGVDRDRLSAALDRGTVEECLHRVLVTAGDCLFIPAGTVHAIGEGVLLAEVQQSSDLTFRLFDWNRVGADGQPRPLHRDDALNDTDFDRGPVDVVTPREIVKSRAHLVEELVHCPYFVIRRHTASEAVRLEFDNRCRILMILDGELEFGDGRNRKPVCRGATLLLPAAALPYSISPAGRAVFLEIFPE